MAWPGTEFVSTDKATEADPPEATAGADGAKLQLTYWGSVPQVSEMVSVKPLRLESVTEVVVCCWVWIVNCGLALTPMPGQSRRCHRLL
jgi:hypothetical protein